MKVNIARPINGISLNGDEYLLDDAGKVREFESEDAAKKFLLEQGVSEEEIESYSYVIVIEDSPMPAWFVTVNEDDAEGSVRGFNGVWHHIGGEVSLGTYHGHTEQEAKDAAHAEYNYVTKESLIARQLA